MPLNIAIDASYFGEGRIVLSGRDATKGIDAALFLTTLRAACEQQDPYFSLDPDDGPLWNKQGEEAFGVLWKRIERDFKPDLSARRNDKIGSTIDIRTVSATRDYANVWREIAPKYPNLRSKLVFHPQWLRETRFGEIFYKADVLLKELSSGVSILAPGRLRASAINGYLAADVERAVKGLVSGPGGPQTQWRGSRLWFDIAPSPPSTLKIADAAPTPAIGDAQLASLIRARGLKRAQGEAPPAIGTIVKDNNVFDLSLINPRMFVRVHDHTTRQDLSDHDPDLDGLASDVTKRFDQYGEAYDELRMLRELFRSYVAAVQITSQSDALCQRLETLPLLESEKVASPLPEYHWSELFITVASYKTISKASRQTRSAMASSINGGVSIAGKRFSESVMREGETAVTRNTKKRIAANNFFGSDDVEPSRKFVLLALDEALSSPVRVASNLRSPGRTEMVWRDRRGASADPSEYEIENEPPSEKLPALGGSSKIGWLLVFLFSIVVLTAYRRSRAPRKFGA